MLQLGYARGGSELPQKRTDRNDVVASAKNPTEGEVGEVQRASRYDLVRALAPRYAHVGKREKGQILDQVCQVTGYTRKHAVALLRQPPPAELPAKRSRRRSPSYGPAEVELLQLCWLVTDGICGKRLAPFLPELLRRLRRWHALRDVPAEVQAQVAQMSAATVDRALRPYRVQHKRRGVSTTKPGTLLKRQIAIRTFADWTDVQPVPRDGPGGALRLERSRPILVHAEHGRCGYRLGRLRRVARQAAGDGLLWFTATAS
jgi:hypothetical protein